jgi:hypothetical protein
VEIAMEGAENLVGVVVEAFPKEYLVTLVHMVVTTAQVAPEVAEG